MPPDGMGGHVQERGGPYGWRVERFRRRFLAGLEPRCRDGRVPCMLAVTRRRVGSARFAAQRCLVQEVTMPPGEVAGRRSCLVRFGRHDAGFRAERWSRHQRLHDPELPVLEVRLDVRVVRSGDERRAGQDPGDDQQERTGDAVVVLIVQPRHVDPRGGAPLEHQNADRAGQDRNRESGQCDRRHATATTMRRPDRTRRSAADRTRSGRQ